MYHCMTGIVVVVVSQSSAVDLSAHPLKPVKGGICLDKTFALYKVTILVKSI